MQHKDLCRLILPRRSLSCKGLPLDLGARSDGTGHTPLKLALFPSTYRQENCGAWVFYSRPIIDDSFRLEEGNYRASPGGFVSTILNEVMQDQASLN